MANNLYRNSEGYYDPTAGAVLAKCDRKEKSDRRKAIAKLTQEQGNRLLP